VGRSIGTGSLHDSDQPLPRLPAAGERLETTVASRPPHAPWPGSHWGLAASRVRAAHAAAERRRSRPHGGIWTYFREVVSADM
jgi:hypothetical protein